LPINADVSSACEILGFDPLYIANEGCCVMLIPEAQTGSALDLLRQHPFGRQASLIGKVVATYPKGMVTLKSTMGVSRVLDLLSGEQLPRIC
jgi:hydrogenase expression/formation protein HypE